MPKAQDKHEADGPEPLTSAERRELIRRGHTISAQCHIGRAGLTPSAVAQLDQTMARRELMKVRIEADSGDEATLIAEELAAKIGATLVQRVGRVALLYRMVPTEDET